MTVFRIDGIELLKGVSELYLKGWNKLFRLYQKKVNEIQVKGNFQKVVKINDGCCVSNFWNSFQIRKINLKIQQQTVILAEMTIC